MSYVCVMCSVCEMCVRCVVYKYVYKLVTGEGGGRRGGGRMGRREQ